ncbi:MAG TPA: FAD-dependent oxidoreductase [Actinomycetota bacterium]|nr:FAD-dependent oxidoreductase [Actinomycetota bacterium]
MSDERPRPVIVAFEEDAAAREQVELELRKRYGSDYEVIVGSIDEAGSTLRRLVGSEVVLVIAGAPDHARALDVLAESRARFQLAKRCLTLNWGDRSATDVLLRGAAMGDIDYWAARPWSARDESFHRAISEFLADWSRANRPPYEVVRLIGTHWDPATSAMRDLLTRNSIPFGSYEAGSADADAILAGSGLDDARLPVVVLHDGRALVQPTGAEVGAAFGLATSAPRGLFDVTIVGAGPAGLAAAVYAASEGLRVAVVERQAIGGQAGTSSLIRNYLGFPRGVSGAELAQRAYEQAWLFGAEFVYGLDAVDLVIDGDRRAVVLADGSKIETRTVIIASGVSYRMLDDPELMRFQGAGVYYGAATSEAPGLAGDDVAVVGGGNSAGQAALYLASHVRRVTVLVRGSSLAESMSEYLIQELDRTSNIEIRYGTEVIGGRGDRRLEGLVVRDAVSGELSTMPLAAVFVLIGAEPRTSWLPGAVLRDRWGSILTGADAGPRAGRAGLETSVPGVFAVGDVRHGAVKRVASAVGEGSVAVGSVHQYLASGDVVGHRPAG